MIMMNLSRWAYSSPGLPLFFLTLVRSLRRGLGLNITRSLVKTNGTTSLKRSLSIISCPTLIQRFLSNKTIWTMTLIKFTQCSTLDSTQTPIFSAEKSTTSLIGSVTLAASRVASWSSPRSSLASLAQLWSPSTRLKRSINTCRYGRRMQETTLCVRKMKRILRTSPGLSNSAWTACRSSCWYSAAASIVDRGTRIS